MLQNVLSNLKNIKPAELAKELRSIDPKSLVSGLRGKAQENLVQLKPENIKHLASQAVTQAMASGEEEILKAVRAGADKVISGRDDVTEDVKTEIRAIVTEFEMTPRGALEHLKGAGGFLRAHIPKSFDDVKNFRSSIALALISEAQKRIAARKAEEIAGKGHKSGSRGSHGGQGGQGHEGRGRHEGRDGSHSGNATSAAAEGARAESPEHGGTETVSTRDGEISGVENPRVERATRKKKHAHKDEASH